MFDRSFPASPVRKVSMSAASLVAMKFYSDDPAFDVEL
jgi:hypothetical protein